MPPGAGGKGYFIPGGGAAGPRTPTPAPRPMPRPAGGKPPMKRPMRRPLFGGRR